MAELRNLLLAPEQLQLRELQERLDNPSLLANDVSNVLPEAIVIRTSRDRKVATALQPTIEESIKASVTKNPRVLVNALFPVMGPAIRKSIYSTILGMIQSFSQALEYSFSLRGIKWRLEALKTGKPFAEIVLLHTLVYQVEQVFLIHQKTALVLQHVVGKEATVQDPDLVSGMLTAIQDFVRDSFGAEQDETLETLQVGGGRSVWIEQGPEAILAAVIHGIPPQDLRLTLRETLENIHLSSREALDAFDGNTAPFEATRDALNDCLKYQLRPKKLAAFPLLWSILGLLVTIACCWSIFSYREHQRWSHYLERLHGEPGILVAAAEKRWGKYYISGLRDPLAPDPAKMLAESELRPDEVVFSWKPFHSVYPKYMLERIENILNPPETVNLKLENDILSAHGSAPHQWIVESRKLAKAIPGLRQYKDDGVTDLSRVELERIEKLLNPPETVNLNLENDILSAHGSAPHQWIVESRKLAKDIPGLRQYTDDGVADLEVKEMEMAAQRVGQQYLLFPSNQKSLLPGQEAKVEVLVGDIERLLRLSQTLEKKAVIEIIGHADSTGSESTNIQLSKQRADEVLTLLILRGLRERNFTTLAVGSGAALRPEFMESDRELNRSATFRVTFTGYAN